MDFLTVKVVLLLDIAVLERLDDFLAQLNLAVDDEVEVLKFIILIDDCLAFSIVLL